MFAAADRRGDLPPYARVAVDIVGDHRLLDPLQINAGVFEHANHPNGVCNIPAHVRICHQLDVRPDRIANGPYQLQISPHPGETVSRAVAEALLHCRKALFAECVGLPGEPAQIFVRVKPAGVDRNPLAGSSAKQVINRLAGCLAENVPERDINRADRFERQSLAALVEGAAEHFLPQQFDIERIFAQ